MTLEDFTRYLGVAVALVGAFVVSPQSAALFLKRSASPLGRSVRRWRGGFRRSGGR